MAPPKKPSLLAKHKKNVKLQVAQGKKEIDIDTLTVQNVRDTKQITILKVWGKKLGIPDLLSYKVANIESLKKAIIEKLESREEKETVDVREEDDQDLEKQYSAIEKFLLSYSKNPNKTTGIYGSMGNEFNNMWKDLSRNDKIIFIQEYFELNIEPNKVNPVVYLQGYVDSKKEKKMKHRQV